MNFKDDDYLWNGTGEPDPDVQRLEQVLGKLRYQHTELKLPAQAAAPRHARHAVLYRNLVAAGVAFVMLAAGTWLYFRRDVDGSTPRSEIAVVNQRTNAAGQDEKGAGDGGQTDGARNLEDEKRLAAATADETTGDARRVEKPDKVDAKGGRRIDGRNGDVTRRRGRVAAVNVASNPASSASRAEGERAKAQLMLALYITSDKLAFVQKKMQGDVQVSPSKIEPERDLLR